MRGKRGGGVYQVFHLAYFIILLTALYRFLIVFLLHITLDPPPFAQEIKFKKSLFRNNIWMTRSGVEELELLSKMHTNPTPARPATSNPFP